MSNIDKDTNFIAEQVRKEGNITRYFPKDMQILETQESHNKTYYRWLDHKA